MKEKTADEMKTLIPLAASHVNQYTTKDGKSPWEVQENETNDLLAILPREITDAQMFKIMAFAKKFELLAFNIGMNYMRDELKDNWENEKNNLIKVIRGLEEANERLAETLGKFIGEEEE